MDSATARRMTLGMRLIGFAAGLNKELPQNVTLAALMTEAGELLLEDWNRAAAALDYPQFNPDGTTK